MLSLFFADGTVAEYGEWEYHDYFYPVANEPLGYGAMAVIGLILLLELYLYLRHSKPPRT